MHLESPIPEQPLPPRRRDGSRRFERDLGRMLWLVLLIVLWQLGAE